MRPRRVASCPNHDRGPAASTFDMPQLQPLQLTGPAVEHGATDLPGLRPRQPSLIPRPVASPGPGKSGPANVCAGGAKGRVGCKAFDQMAGELKA